MFDKLRPAKLLRIFLLEHERIHGKPLYHAIIEQARKLNLEGATVLRAIAGYSMHSRISSAGIVDIAADLPLVIEIVEQEENLAKLLPFIDEHLKDGLVTIEDITVVRKFPLDRNSN